MLSENTKITIRNAATILIFLAGLGYGYMVTIGGIHNRLTALETNDNSKQKKLDEIHASQIRQEDKLDRLIERNGK